MGLVTQEVDRGGHMRGAAQAVAAMVLTGGFAASAVAATYEGAPVKIGEGYAHVVIETDVADQPTDISVVLSRGALTGLPGAPNSDNKEGAWSYFLPMPEGVSNTGFRTVVVDWMAAGHPPPHVYTVPHFDFHFYTIGPQDLEQIKFAGPDDPAAKVTDASLVPEGYQVVAETAVDKMGVHAIDTSATEFHGKPFTATFIYGYYAGRLVFLEPMVARDFLLSEPDFAASVMKPEHISLGGHYPAGYRVRYDPPEQAWRVSLTGLEYRTDVAPGAR